MTRRPQTPWLRARLTLLLAAAASGCCPSFAGSDDVLEFNSCVPPDRPVLVGTRWDVLEAGGAPLTWTSDAPSIVEVLATEDRPMVALAPGSAQLRATRTDDGAADRVTYEPVFATGLDLVDPITEYIRAANEDAPDPPVLGDRPALQPGDPVLVVRGATPALALLPRGPDDVAVSWSPEAFAADGFELVPDGVVLRPGALRIRDAAGTEQLAAEVQEVDLDAGTRLGLAFSPSPRANAADALEADAPRFALASLSLGVQDAAGEPVYGVPVTWRATGAVRVEGLARYGRIWDRADSVEAVIEDRATLEQIASRSFCVTASVETAVGTLERSVRFGPSETEAFEGGDCGAPGCACSAAPLLPSGGLGVVVSSLLLLPGRRRRGSV